MSKRTLEGEPRLEEACSAAEILLDERQGISIEHVDAEQPEEDVVVLDVLLEEEQTIDEPPIAPKKPHNLVLVGAASLLSHGLRFQKNVPLPVADEDLRLALLRTGFFREE